MRPPRSLVTKRPDNSISVDWLSPHFYEWQKINNKSATIEDADEFCKTVGIKQVTFEHKQAAKYYVVDEQKYLLAKIKYGAN